MLTIRRTPVECHAMMDIVYIALIVFLFAATAGLVRFCAGLQSKGGKP
jgi:hypothetical protein